MRGWVKIFSYTRPRENIVRYRPWHLKCDQHWQERALAEGQAHGKGVIARLEGCDDREQAAALIGCEIGIRREQLPATSPGEYYWSDLEGLTVVTDRGDVLGTVDHLIETGANDVMVVHGDRERLIPFVMQQVVLDVDLHKGEIRVDWDKDF